MPSSTQALVPHDPLPPPPLAPASAAGGTAERDRVATHALASDIARLHSDALLRTARRVSLCADDAHDAYQRALELLLEHAGTIDRAKAVGWMHVVVRREAGAIRRGRGRTVSLEDDDVDRAMHRLTPAADDHVHAIDLAQRAGEALAMLKEAEAQALCLRAQGMSYEEIGDAYGWSYTKVNRAVSEGRRAFVDHYLAVERGAVCSETAELVGDFAAGTLGARATVRVRAHLVRCSACRSLLHAERQADTALRALLPPAFLAASAGRAHGGETGWLQEHLLAPLGHAVGRLQPAAEQLVGGKIGLAAASTIALAGGGVAVDHQVKRAAAPPPALSRSVVRGTPPTTQDQGSGGLTAAVTAAVTRERELSAARAALVRRQHAEAARRAAKEARAVAATRNDFTPAGGEFSASATGGASTVARSASASSPTAAAPETTATEVSAFEPPADSSLDVTVDGTSVSNAPGSVPMDRLGA